MIIPQERDVMEGVSAVVRRAYVTCDRFGRCRRTAWGGWGRWVAMGIILAVFLFSLLLFSHMSARRRRQRGLTPLRGTAWVGPKNVSPTNQGVVRQKDSNPAPPYSPPSGDYYAPPPGPPPQNAYSGEQTFNPPPGPPPASDQYYPPPNSPPPAHLTR